MWRVWHASSALRPLLRAAAAVRPSSIHCRPLGALHRCTGAAVLAQRHIHSAAIRSSSSSWDATGADATGANATGAEPEHHHPEEGAADDENDMIPEHLSSESAAVRLDAEQRQLERRFRDSRFDRVIHMYESHLQQLAGEIGTLPPFQYGHEFDELRDVDPFRWYLTSLFRTQPERASQVAQQWISMHGVSATQWRLYPVMLAAHLHSPDKLKLCSALLRALLAVQIPCQLPDSVLRDIVRMLLDTGDLRLACNVFTHCRSSDLLPSTTLVLFFAFRGHDCMGMCVDLFDTMATSERGAHRSDMKSLHKRLTDLLLHLRGTKVDKQSWTPALFAADPRMRDKKWVQAELSKIESHPAWTLATSNTDVASDSAWLASKAVLRLQQMLADNTATRDAFERALEGADPDGAINIWRVLASAQPDRPISRPNPNDPPSVGLLAGATISALHVTSDVIAPDSSVYNRAIQQLCSDLRKTKAEHSSFALGLFQRMQQLGMARTMPTYSRLMLALSGRGWPPTSGLHSVYQSYLNDYEELVALRAQVSAGTLPADSTRQLHPEFAHFSLTLSAFESLLFAYTVSSFTPQLLELANVHVSNLERRMRELGLVQNERVRNSILLLAIRHADVKRVQTLWRAMQADSQIQHAQRSSVHPEHLSRRNDSLMSCDVCVLSELPMLAPTIFLLVRMCARSRWVWEPRINEKDLSLVHASVPLLKEVWHAATIAHERAIDGQTEEQQRQKRSAGGFITAPLVEYTVLALARAYAGCLRAATSLDKRNKAMPELLQLQLDLLAVWRWSVDHHLTLSHHAYMHVACALDTVQQHAAVESSEKAVRQKKQLRAVAMLAQKVPVAQRYLDVLADIRRTGFSAPPQLVLRAFTLNCGELRRPSDASELSRLLHSFLQLARDPTFVRQAFMDYRTDVDAAAEQRLWSSLLTDATRNPEWVMKAKERPYRHIATVKAWKRVVQEELVLYEVPSRSVSFTADDAAEREQPTHADPARRPPTPVEALLLSSVGAHALRQSDAEALQLDVSTSVSVFAEASAPPSPAAGMHVSAAHRLSDTSRWLVLLALHDMTTAVLAVVEKRLPELDDALTMLLEQLWTGAAAFDVREQLLTGRLRLYLPAALLHLRHPHAIDVAVRFCRGLSSSDALLPDDALMAARLLHQTLPVLVRRGRPLADVEDVLRVLDYLPPHVTAEVFTSAQFYRSVFVAYGLHGHMVKIGAAVQRLSDVEHGDAKMNHAARNEAAATLLLRSAPELIEAWDRCGALEELQQLLPRLRRAADIMHGSSAELSIDSSFVSAIFSLVLRASVRLLAFSDARESNGYTPTRRGDDTLRWPTDLLRSSPFYPDVSTLLCLLKCCLLAQDNSSARRVIDFIVAQAAYYARSDLELNHLQALSAAMQGWPTPPGVDSEWSHVSESYPHFMLSGRASHDAAAPVPDSVSVAAAVHASGGGAALTDALTRHSSALLLHADAGNVSRLLVEWRALCDVIASAERILHGASSSSPASVFSLGMYGSSLDLLGSSVAWPLRILADRVLSQAAARIIAQAHRQTN